MMKNQSAPKYSLSGSSPSGQLRKPLPTDLPTPTPRHLNTSTLLDSIEAARILKIHPRTAIRMARRGELPGLRIGKLWRFRQPDLDDWLDAKVSSQLPSVLVNER